MKLLQSLALTLAILFAPHAFAENGNATRFQLNNCSGGSASAVVGMSSFQCEYAVTTRPGQPTVTLNQKYLLKFYLVGAHGGFVFGMEKEGKNMTPLTLNCVMFKKGFQDLEDGVYRFGGVKGDIAAELAASGALFVGPSGRCAFSGFSLGAGGGVAIAYITLEKEESAKKRKWNDFLKKR